MLKALRATGSSDVARATRERGQEDDEIAGPAYVSREFSAQWPPRTLRKTQMCRWVINVACTLLLRPQHPKLSDWRVGEKYPTIHHLNRRNGR